MTVRVTIDRSGRDHGMEVKQYLVGALVRCPP